MSPMKRKFTLFSIVIAALFALGAVAVYSGELSVLKGAAASFLGFGALCYVFLAILFARPETPPTIA